MSIAKDLGLTLPIVPVRTLTAKRAVDFLISHLETSKPTKSIHPDSQYASSVARGRGFVKSVTHCKYASYNKP
jgi:hypothetical protein